MTNSVENGFAPKEFSRRIEKCQSLLSLYELDALVISSSVNFRYYSGFATQFWESPTRSWFMIIPESGNTTLIGPEIGGTALSSTNLADIRTYASPAPEDNGVSLLAKTLNDLAAKSGKIGFELGRECQMRMPFNDFFTVQKSCARFQFVDASQLIWQQRMIKSDAEVDKIRHICAIASEAFDDLPSLLKLTDTDDLAAKFLKSSLINKGSHTIPYLACALEKNGYSQIILEPTGTAFRSEDVLFLDIGATFDGYFCDFDRNFAIGKISDEVSKAHETLHLATESAFRVLEPGQSSKNLWDVMADTISRYGYERPTSGRMGHGLGMQLTEPPSICLTEDIPLTPSMVLTIEPSLMINETKMLVHEENIVITQNGYELLTKRAPRVMPIIG